VKLFTPQVQDNMKKNYSVNRDFLTKYISYARSSCFPKITDRAEKVLISAYLEMRSIGQSKNIITATPR
jgi:DNA replication licensing factor MCM4